MPRPKYPLQPVLEDRQRKVDDQAAELGQSIRRREAAEAAKAKAEAVKREAEQAAAAVRADEAEALARGELRAIDLMRAEAWEVAEKARIDSLSRAADAAAAKAASAQREEVDARVTLAQKKAEHDVVVKDKGRFAERLAKKAQAAEEEAAEEAWRPKGSR